MGTSVPETSAVLPYETRIRDDFSWGMDEADRHFQKRNLVFQTMRTIAGRLDQLGITYAVAGGLALFAHGYRRLTIDVDLLVTPEGMQTIQTGLLGQGYAAIVAGRRSLRDAQTGVRVDFLVTGEFPGDGLPKPVGFPDPAGASVAIDRISFLALAAVVELKLASGMTRFSRMRDLADVIELMKTLRLPAEFSEKLAPYVRDKYLEFWHAIRESPIEPVEPWIEDDSSTHQVPVGQENRSG